ncbi:galactokinase-like [Neodiprion fabricii]|uniref:galactokinase-like n=1 Tax=Neodiprion fabricii TaxID=2872261 RepID=UPI001ED915B9|nr:galactokinase-like [Neodiprion fabricii]
MWESHCSMRDNFGSSCSQVERIMSMIQNIPGVYGARIVGRDFGTIVLVLVHRHAVKTMVNALRSGDQCQEYQVVKPSSGSGILYADTNEQLLPIVSNKKRLRKSHRNNLFVGDYNDYHQQYDTIYGIRGEKTFTPVKETYTKY